MSQAAPVLRDAAAPGSRLPDLIAMAAEPSSERRRALLRELTDHFFGGQRSPTEDRLYDEVLTALAAEMEAAVRAELSARFARAADAPPRLIRRLATDEVDAVSRAVLAGSPVLVEADLLGVVRTRGQDQLRAVAGRQAVSEAVSDVIVQRGDDETLGRLLENDGAALSRAASETAVRRAKANPALHAAAVERRALPLDLLNEMYFVVETRLRQRILEQNVAMDPALLEAALAAGRSRVAAEDGALPDDYAEAVARVREMKTGGAMTAPMLARLVRAESRTPFLVALCELAEIDFHIAQGIVERSELDALAVVCKAADLERSLFLTYAVVLLGADRDAMSRAHGYARLYAELDRDAALRTLRFWRLRRAA